jgi:hypothetical protein
MGHKGVSIRKPKRSRPFSSADISGASNTRSVERPLAQTVLKDNGASLSRGGLNPNAGSNKKHKKGN